MDLAKKLLDLLLAKDDLAVFRLLAQTTNAERLEAARVYESLAHTDLNQHIKAQMRDRYVRLAQNMFVERYEYWVLQLKDSIRGLGTNEKKLIPLVMMQSDEDTRVLRPLYKQLIRKQTMLADIADDVSNDAWGRLLKSWMAGAQVFQLAPQIGLEQLRENPRESMLRILCTTRPDAYQQLNLLYAQKSGKKHQLDAFIKTEFTGKAEWAYLMGHYYLLNQAQGAAFALWSAPNDEVLQILTVLFSDQFRGAEFARHFKTFSPEIALDLKRTGTKIDDAVQILWGIA